MRGPGHLLRKAALERLSSPEQLDMAMRVTTPVAWVAMTAFGTLIASLVAWSIVYQLPVKVDGSGILLRGETVRTVQVPATGTVVDLLVREGDMVEEGQVVAHLHLPDLVGQIASSRDRIEELEIQVSKQEGQMSSLRRSYEAQIRDLRSQLSTQEDLHRRGLARRQDVLAIQGQIAAIQSQMLQSDLGQTSRSNVLDEERRALRQLESKLETDTVVRSVHSGRVAAILASPGEMVSAGARILNLEEADEPFQFVIFVPFAEGKKIEPRMEVRLSPTTVQPEEFGFILGEIVSVSSQPVTPEEVRRTLNNDALAQRYAQDTPFKVVAAPRLDPATPSGFAWTSSAGPPIEISSSTPGSAQVIVERRRPISYVIPMAKKTLGIG